MASGLAVFAILLLIAQTTSNGCGDDPAPDPDPAPSPATPAPPAPASGVFTTLDGVRFRVETIATGLDIPWSLAFAPDGRLFIAERPGRVRIMDVSARTSEVAL